MESLFIAIGIAVIIAVVLLSRSADKKSKELSVTVSHDDVAGHGTQHKGTNRDDSDD